MTIQFTGDVAFKQKLYQVLLQNELGGVAAAAYKLSDAGNGSGWSFGQLQFDLSHCRKTFKDIFKGILKNAKDANGVPIIHDANNKPDTAMVDKLYAAAISLDKSLLAKITGGLDLINAALANSTAQVDAAVTIVN